MKVLIFVVVAVLGVGILISNFLSSDDPPSVVIAAATPSAPARPTAVEQSLVDLIGPPGQEETVLRADKLIASGIPASSKIVGEIKAYFQNTKSNKEKIRYARMFNSAYFNTTDPTLRAEISRTLSELLAAESDPSVGRELALSHSRLIFDQNTLENLSSAYKRKLIGFDDYYGELAHVFPASPPEVRSGIIDQLSASHNRYAADIVANFAAKGEGAMLTNSESISLKKYLSDNEPIFSGNASSFGMFEAIRVDQWLRAVGTLEQSTGSKSRGQYISEKLTDPKADPRFAVAYLISPAAREYSRNEISSRDLQTIQSKALQFIAEHPSSTPLQQAGMMIKSHENR